MKNILAAALSVSFLGLSTVVSPAAFADTSFVTTPTKYDPSVVSLPHIDTNSLSVLSARQLTAATSMRISKPSSTIFVGKSSWPYSITGQVIDVIEYTTQARAKKSYSISTMVQVFSDSQSAKLVYKNLLTEFNTNSKSFVKLRHGFVSPSSWPTNFKPGFPQRTAVLATPTLLDQGAVVVSRCSNSSYDLGHPGSVKTQQILKKCATSLARAQTRLSDAYISQLRTASTVNALYRASMFFAVSTAKISDKLNVDYKTGFVPLLGKTLTEASDFVSALSTDQFKLSLPKSVEPCLELTEVSSNQTSHILFPSGPGTAGKPANMLASGSCP